VTAAVWLSGECEASFAWAKALLAAAGEEGRGTGFRVLYLLALGVA